MNHDFIYFDEETKITFLCDIYYSPEELGSIDAYGFKNEPDFPAECYIEKMSFLLDHFNRDISPLIDEGIKDYIIQKFLEEFSNDET
jgi:hypothetical protein